MQKKNRLMHSTSYQGMIERKDSEYLEHFGIKGMKWGKRIKGIGSNIKTNITYAKNKALYPYETNNHNVLTSAKYKSEDRIRRFYRPTTQEKSVINKSLAKELPLLKQIRKEQRRARTRTTAKVIGALGAAYVATGVGVGLYETYRQKHR